MAGILFHPNKFQTGHALEVVVRVTSPRARAGVCSNGASGATQYCEPVNSILNRWGENDGLESFLPLTHVRGSDRGSFFRDDDFGGDVVVFVVDADGHHLAGVGGDGEIERLGIGDYVVGEKLESSRRRRWSIRLCRSSSEHLWQ